MDHKIIKFDLENRFPNYTFSYKADGDGFIVTATGKENSEVVAKSTWKMSLWDAYENLHQTFLDRACVFPQLLQFQIDLLDKTDIPSGYSLWNLHTNQLERFTGSNFAGAAGGHGLVTTTDNTQTILHSIMLPDDTVSIVTAKILGRNSDLSIVFGKTMECTVKRIGSATLIMVGKVTTFHSGINNGVTSWIAEFIVSGKELTVSVKGSEGITVNWKANLTYLHF